MARLQSTVKNARARGKGGPGCVGGGARWAALGASFLCFGGCTIEGECYRFPPRPNCFCAGGLGTARPLAWAFKRVEAMLFRANTGPYSSSCFCPPFLFVCKREAPSPMLCLSLCELEALRPCFCARPSAPDHTSFPEGMDVLRILSLKLQSQFGEDFVGISTSGFPLRGPPMRPRLCSLIPVNWGAAFEMALDAERGPVVYVSDCVCLGERK